MLLNAWFKASLDWVVVKPNGFVVWLKKGFRFARLPVDWLEIGWIGDMSKGFADADMGRAVSARATVSPAWPLLDTDGLLTEGNSLVGVEMGERPSIRTKASMVRSRFPLTPRSTASFLRSFVNPNSRNLANFF